jgi:diguanylate cyclase (GGDEF)-like protein/PAS domain S-box-containing protein
MFNYNYQNISSWIKLADTVGGSCVNFVIELSGVPNIVNISSNVYELYGYKKDDLVGHKEALERVIFEKDLEEIYQTINNSLFSKRRSQTLCFKINCFDGIFKEVKSHISYVVDKKEKKVYLVGYLIDATQEISFQRKIDYLTNYDSLTGLVNREKIKTIIDKELEENIKTGTSSALLYLDLNRFKNINDTLGHQVGDKLLQHVSHRLISCIKQEDTLARVGDDEFVILLSSLNSKTLYSHIEIIAKRLYKILERPFSIDGNILHITTSIGVSILGVDGKTSDEVLKSADTAMNISKKDQDNYFRYYKTNMRNKTTTNLEIENDLRIAISENQFELYYQPQVDVVTENIIGAEALIRWHHPVKGIISPFHFIPIAEETGLIVDIGKWVLIESFKRIKELQEDCELPKAFKKISVNISSKQFAQANFTTQIEELIADFSINPSFLELEVTEGALISNLDDAIEKMHILKERGIKFSIDDFGTGYSSLSYLKKLPIDIIKIDKSFITNMHTDSDDKILTQTIIQMSQNLRLGLIAEGVEKIEHLNFLQEKGCQSYQGFFFSKPIPFDEFRELLFAKQSLNAA